MGLLSFLGADNAQLAQRASLAHVALLDFSSAENLILETVFGAGVYYSKGKGLRQLLLVAEQKSRLGRGFYNIQEDKSVFSIVQKAIGEGADWLFDLDIGVFPTPEIQAIVGDRISSASFGTAGVGVRWQNGKGFLTAGHVAPHGSNVTLRGKNWNSTNVQ